jgi:NADH dehydrogenase
VLDWDYLLVACGSVPGFSQSGALSLASCADAGAILARIDGLGERPAHCAVGGGGYTGVELASALRRRFPDRSVVITISEPAPAILSALEARVRRASERALARSGIEILTGSGLVPAGRGLRLADGRRPDLACLAAGVRGAAAGLLPAHADAKNGRLIVDPCLRLAPGLYAAGDAARLTDARGRVLRPSVNNALIAGRRAARNILRELRGLPPRRFSAPDLGFVVPVYAAGCASGRALGVPVGGRLGLFLHYLMCVYRSLSWKNRWAVLHGLCRGKPGGGNPRDEVSG